MSRVDIDKLWHQALQKSITDGEQFTRYHFAALVAAAAIKSAPDYKIGYADGVASENEACAVAADEQWVRDPQISGGTAIRARKGKPA